MNALVGISTLAFIVVGSAVGVRLLLLARRTRQLPERALGVGLLVMSAVSYPALIVAQLSLAHPPVVRAGVLGSLLALAVGCSATLVFTWKVYRPDAAWARHLARAIFAAWGLLVVVEVPRTFSLPADQLIRQDLRFALREGLIVLTMLWTAVESLRYHARMRRQLALGLADAVVVDRVLLWAVSSSLSVLSAGVILVVALTGTDPLQLAGVKLVIALGGTGSSVALLLAFLPPQAYLARVRRRAAAREVA